MATAKRRLTLDLDLPIQQRLKMIAALKGVSMSRYCQDAIGKALARDEAQGLTDLPFGHEALNRLADLQREVFGGETVSGDPSDFSRES